MICVEHCCGHGICVDDGEYLLLTRNRLVLAGLPCAVGLMNGVRRFHSATLRCSAKRRREICSVSIPLSTSPQLIKSNPANDISYVFPLRSFSFAFLKVIEMMP